MFCIVCPPVSSCVLRLHRVWTGRSPSYMIIVQTGQQSSRKGQHAFCRHHSQANPVMHAGVTRETLHAPYFFNSCPSSLDRSERSAGRPRWILPELFQARAWQQCLLSFDKSRRFAYWFPFTRRLIMAVSGLQNSSQTFKTRMSIVVGPIIHFVQGNKPVGRTTATGDRSRRGDDSIRHKYAS